MTEGLTAYEGPQTQVNEGQLPTPPEFDKTKFAGKWVLDGPQVMKAQQSEMIQSARMVAQGWAVWRSPKSKEPCKRNLGKAAYILMFRPKALQTAVNKLHANTSRMRVSDEISGETVQGQPRQMANSQGLLSNSDLNQYGKNEDIEAPNLPLHRIDLEESVVIQTQ